MQHGGQRDAGPLAGAQDHSFLSTRGFWALAFEIFEESGVAAGAFHNGADAAAREAAQLVEVAGQGLFDSSANSETVIDINGRSTDRGGRVRPAGQPVPSNRARKKAQQPASPLPRTGSSNPVPSSEESCKPSVPRGRLSQSGTRSSNPASSSGESANHRFLRGEADVPVGLLWTSGRPVVEIDLR